MICFMPTFRNKVLELEVARSAVTLSLLETTHCKQQISSVTLAAYQGS